MPEPFSLEALAGELAELPIPRRYWLAYSGGLDSTVLVHALSRLQSRLTAPVSVIHINHGLHEQADEWAEHCQQQCQALGLDFRLHELDLTPMPRKSLEALARDARYRAIARYLGPKEMLLTAHHADDQAETFLLQWLRGAGVRGLAAMPMYKTWHHGWLARPLLKWPRTALADWARRQGLHWIDDPSNQNLDIRRNFLRHEILPRLRKQWPGVHETARRSAFHCAEAAHLLAELATEDLNHCQGRTPWQLNMNALQRLSRARQKNLLRHWPESLGLSSPGHRLIERILNESLNAAPQRQPLIAWPGAEIRRYRGHLYLMPELLPAPPAGYKQRWDPAKPLSLPSGLGYLECLILPGDEQAALDVCFAPDGLKCALVGRQGRKNLKALAQELGIPPWLRPRLPIVCHAGRVLAVADYAQCTKTRLRLTWHRPPWLDIRPSHGEKAV